MANIQGAYGHADVFAPGVFDFYADATAGGTLATGQVINLQTSNFVAKLSGALTALTVNLPLNPPDGAVAEFNCTGANITTLTVQANTGDTLSAAFAATLTANTPVRFKYSLFGDITKGAAPRQWIRVQ